MVWYVNSTQTNYPCGIFLSFWMAEQLVLVGIADILERLYLHVIKCLSDDLNQYQVIFLMWADLSTDQRYLRDICHCVSTGEIPSSLATRSPGQLNHSRWLTAGNRILRLYIGTTEPSDNLKNAGFLCHEGICSYVVRNKVQSTVYQRCCSSLANHQQVSLPVG